MRSRYTAVFRGPPWDPLGTPLRYILCFTVLRVVLLHSLHLREIELIVEPMGFLSLEIDNPEVFPLKKGVADLFSCHVLVRDFLNDYHPKIVERVVWQAKVLVDCNRTIFF